MTFLRFSGVALSVMVFAFACADDPKEFEDGTGGTRNNSGGVSSGGKNSGGQATEGGAGGTATGGASHTGGTADGGSSSGTGGGEIVGGEGGAGGASGGASGGEAGSGTGGAEAGGGGAGNLGGAAGAAGEAGAGTAGTGNEGGAVEIGSSNYPFPAGSDTIPKPTGVAGGLKVLNWAGFKGAISYTFDDSNGSQIEHYSGLQALGVRFTFYLQTGKPEINSPTWIQAHVDGHDIGNHTVHHLNQTNMMSLDNPGDEVDLATQDIKAKTGATPLTLAAPYGDPIYSDLAKTRFFINRGVSDGLMLPNDSMNPFSLFCYIPPPAAVANTVLNPKVDDARTKGGWRVFLVHGFTGGVTDYAFQPLDFSEFTANVTYAKSFGDVWIDSVVNVGAYWLGQRAFLAGTPSSSDGTSTWTWQLPAHFPHGQYLRVQVDGGTLTQGETTLEWNGHGFYEVALDAKSLTLSP